LLQHNDTSKAASLSTTWMRFAMRQHVDHVEQNILGRVTVG